ncbi:ABC transporter G family member 36 [Phytophthora nicotianae]|uniref:ABC transporter G family member 36 n=1 Tax=Phytophthora nicotianae TaxID=4792 RepID=A0A0W8C047_PHYNI|nr:ABC transporter G family member 36 [Phytophthora nicotianae]
MTKPVSTLLESNIGTQNHSLPKLEIRCKDLSVITESEEVNSSALPSIWNRVKNAATKFARRSTQRRVLNQVNAVFKPGTLTLVVGQPGSGKSILMKVLSGQLPMGKNITVEGNISYSGLAWKEVLPKLPQLAAYVPQSDQHFPSLTVQETLEFARVCCAGDTPSRDIIGQLGLQTCRDTKLGNGMTRGVSGGEQRRVTTGEMAIGNKCAFFMDETSTGLDSATTFDIVRKQREIAKQQHKTFVMALLQPAPEVFELFDSILLLNEGEVVYHGPRDQVLPYFQTLGLLCPLDVDVADFLSDIGTKQQRQYESGRSISTRVPKFGGELADCFRRSSIFMKTMRILDTPCTIEQFHDAVQHLMKTPTFRQSFLVSTLLLIRRQMTISFRNKEFLCVRGVMVVIGGVIYGTTFFRADLTNVQVTMGIVYQTAIFLSVGQSSEIPTFIAAREIYYKQRRANFYRTSSFVIAYLTAALPVLVSECVIFGSLVYWMCGFVAEVAPFLVFLLGMILSSVALSSSYVILSVLSPNEDVAQPLSSLSTVLFSVFAGFVVPMAEIPAYFSWLYWLNPVTWCVRSVIVSQYRSPSFDVCMYGDKNYCERFNSTVGEYLLSQYDVPSREGWVWGGMVYLVVAIVLFVAVANYFLEHKRFDTTSVANNVNSRLTKHSKKEEDKLQVQLKEQYSNAGNTDYYFKIGSLVSSTRLNLVSDTADDKKQFKPVTLAFTNLWYSVKTDHKSIDLLKDISGYALPGTMTALMGSSGAGKTTLMDVIAGRKTGGTMRGEIMLNGFLATERAVRRCTGYCEQQDTHSEGSTIREALMFSALLRQDSSVSTEAKCGFVEECLDLLGLRSIADQVIRGRSQEQMKRLTIGVELAAQPSVLFLDEPTSGLDAHSAKMIMDGVRKVANTGRTVVCTIHQPSPDIFFLFDSLLVLKRGGEMLFFGNLVNPFPDQRECGHLIDYFESIPGVPRLPEDQNPATWMLQCIGAGVETVGNNQQHVDFVRHFYHSHEYLSLFHHLNHPGVAKPALDQLSEVTFDNKRAANSLVQLSSLIRRFFTMYWRTPSFNLTRLVISLGLGLFFGLLLVRGDYTSYQGINSAVGVILMTILTQGNISFYSVLPFTAVERASFYRERNVQTYNVLWYFVGSTLVEIPYAFTSGLLFSAVFYPMMGFSSLTTGLLYWINVSLFVLVETYLGQFLVYALPTLDLATIVGVLFNSFFLLFSGFNPPAASIPIRYKWCYYISPHRFSLSLLVALLFGACSQEQDSNENTVSLQDGTQQTGCQILENAPLSISRITVKDYIDQVYNIKHDDMGLYFRCILVYIIALRVLSLLALRHLNHQNR